jgi:hypothetical protein
MMAEGQYLVGLPVGVSIDADGQVTLEVYAEDLVEAIAEDGATAEHRDVVSAFLAGGTAFRGIRHLTAAADAPAADPDDHPVCSDPGCRLHGIAASNRRQSEFYAANDRTVEARPDEAVCGHCDKTVEVSGGWLVDHEVGPRGSELCNGSGSTPDDDDDDLPPCSTEFCVVPAAVVHRGVLLCAPCWRLLPPGAR